MRPRRMPEMKEGGVNVTPLIDIVMCLIIFFMLVAKIGVTTGAEQGIDIPATSVGLDVKKIGIESSFVLNVRDVSGEPFVTGLIEEIGGQNRTAQLGEIKVVDPVTQRHVLADKLRRLRYGRDGKPGGLAENADNEHFNVIIRADKDLAYSALQPVLQACMEANVRNVNFNTKKESGQRPAGSGQ